MEQLREAIVKLRPKYRYHYICDAGSTIRRVDRWGKEATMLCEYKGTNDWGRTYKTNSPCLACHGILTGFLDLSVYDRAYNNAITEVLKIIDQQ